MTARSIVLEARHLEVGELDIPNPVNRLTSETGSSAINGLYLTRPGEIEVNAWSGMLGGMDGAENWSWDSLYAAMKKSETFTPPSAAIAQEADITWNAASRGTSGPIQASYPGLYVNSRYTWMDEAHLDQHIHPGG